MLNSSRKPIEAISDSPSVSISHQISRVVMITAAIAIVVTMSVMLAVAAVLAQSASVERARTIAQLLAASAEVPLILNDAERGREVLSALSTSEGVIGARLIDRNANELASTKASSVEPFAAAGNSILRRLDMNKVTAVIPVVDQGDTLGYAEVTIREQYLSRALSGFVASGFGVLAAMALIWVVISRSIGRSVSMPLTRFSEVTRKIRDTGDFTHRLPANDHVSEVRALSEDFNAMLAVIERSTTEVRERNRDLAQLAFYDPLTGAANRVLLLDRLTQLIDAHRRDGQPFAVVAFDLDDFKLINDRLGHQVGDAYLRALTIRCKAELRAADTFARLGGDEFIALLPEVATRENALIIAHKLAAAVHGANHVHALPNCCTASMGVALYPVDGESTDTLLARVDAAMYRAKAAGRNQIRCVGELLTSEQNRQVSHEN
ncbi:MAG: diguanylate cyclase [Rhizobacter sp.]|nr:diguanylate cyclase [Burkholderiales bacterium]